MTAKQGTRWIRRPEGSNWGDFGPDDHIGRMNLITPAIRRAAVSEVCEGVCFSLSLPLDYPGGSALAHGTRHPPKLFSESFNKSVEVLPGCCDVSCDDGVVIYSQYSTQWDSLAHWGQRFDADGDGVAEKVYYNGWRGDEHFADSGTGTPYAHALGMEHLAVAGAQGRGVLVDLSEETGAVGYDVLMRNMDVQKVEVKPGDFLCFHSGTDEIILSMNRQPDPARIANVAGLDPDDPLLLRWIDDSGIVAICSDNLAVEKMDFQKHAQQTGNFSLLPLHEHCLFKLGIHLGELWHLAALKTWLRANERSAFLLTSPPWRLPGSVGSPVNPIATV